MKINAPTLHLKEINCVDCLTGRIEIVSAPKLESLNISNSYFVVDTEPNPIVKHLRLEFDLSDEIYELDQISSIFPCLETLVLCFEGEEIEKDDLYFSDSFEERGEELEPFNFPHMNLKEFKKLS